jgi:hypothetical protein
MGYSLRVARNAGDLLGRKLQDCWRMSLQNHEHVTDPERLWTYASEGLGKVLDDRPIVPSGESIAERAPVVFW